MAVVGKLLVGLMVATLALSLVPAVPAAHASSEAPAAKLDNVSEVAATTIWYVDQDASGSNSGTSWADAYNYLQDALAAAGAGHQIWVAEGVYKPDQGGGNAPGDREATFALVDSVAIYGGFVGGETSRTERDWEMNEIVLSGDLGSGYYSYHVVTGSGTDETAILDGFTITSGNANGSTWPTYHGGGMYNNGSSPTLANCTFSGNSAAEHGGGMYNNGSSPTLTNCTFSGNEAEEGGGMYNYGGSPTLTNCTFSGNEAEEGGGMYNDGSSPTLTNCTCNGNTAVRDGGGMFNFNDSGPTLTNCTFSGNAGYKGGGMLNNDSSATLINCIFSGNSAVNFGGGMANFGDSTYIIAINCTFSGNSAAWDGGGMFIDDSGVNLTNCILWGNSDGGGSDESAQIYMVSGTLLVNYSCVQGWTGALGGTGNIGGNPLDDPLFMDADGFDNIVGTLDDNLRLSAGSPCIDAGDNDAVPFGLTTDLDGRDRIIDGVVDMGAYEYESEALTAEEQIQLVVEYVDELLSQEGQKQGRGNALKSKLWGAVRALGRGRTNAAVNELQAFINQVNAYEKAGILTVGEADALRHAIEDVIDRI